MRRRILTALIFLTVAAPALAAPRPLTRISGLSEFALAGEQILVSRTQGANLRVFAFPVTGGAARQVFSFDAPNGLRLESARLAASAQRAALTITMVKSFRDNIGAVQAFAGPVGGGWSELQPFTELRPIHPGFDFNIQVDGERIFTLESRGGFGDPRIVVRDPDAHEVAFASSEEATFATFAGDFVAYRTRAADESVDDRDFGDVLVVRDWRTRAVMSSADLQDDIGSIALRPDGRVAATTDGGALYEVRPGAPPRLLTRRGGSVTYAGDSLVYRSGGGLRVIEASGRIRRFGAPTASLYGFATDGSRVVWEANGCLLVDDVSAPPAAALGPGPCPRSELALPAQPGPHLAHTLPVVLRCVAAPRACRGTLRLSTADEGTLAHKEAISRRVRFSIPAGHARRLSVPLTGRGYRILRRNVERAKADSELPRDAIVVVDARTDDGERFPGEAKPDGVLTLARSGAQIQPPKGSSPAVRRVYADYRRDGIIDVCAHSLRALKRTLVTIDPKFDMDFPDFRAAIEAGIDRHAVCADHHVPGDGVESRFDDRRPRDAVRVSDAR
jgi:hypothetical protein